MLIEQRFCPIAKRSSKPAVDRHAKAHLRPFDEFAGDVSVEQLAKDPFTLAVAYLEVQRQPPGELDHAPVEIWHTRFERNRHRRAIDLCKDVVGKVAEHVESHHPLDRAEPSELGRIAGGSGPWLGCADYDSPGVAPQRKHASV